MPGSLSLDAVAAARLGDLDPALALLARALPAATDRARWSLHDAQWTPGEGCRLAYRLSAPSAPSTFVGLAVTGAGWSRQDYRDDPGLPGLADAADATAAAALVWPLLDEPVRTCRVEPVRYRPGSRCVLRYDVETASGHTTMYGKAFDAGTFPDASAGAVSLADSPTGAGLVPRVTAVWPRLRMVVGEAVDGRRVSAVLEDPAVAAADRARLARRLGALLARFHAQTGVTARSWSAEQQVESLDAAMPAAERADARLGRRLRAALDLLADALPDPGAPVLAHGGFRAGQVILAGDGRLVVLDTDGLCRCDAGRDLGAALAHLTWQGIRRPEQRYVLRGAERALLSGYEDHAGALDPVALRWWRVAGLLQVAVRRYHRLEIGAWPLVETLADAAEVLLLEHQAQSLHGGATDLLDTRQMTGLLRLHLAATAVAPRELVVESADQLASASGRRSVVRYAVRGLDGGHAVPVVGKAFTDSDRADLLHCHLRALSAGPFQTGALRVPEPLGLLAEQRMVLYRACDGVPLDLLTDRKEYADGVRRAVRWLVRLHGCDVRLPRRFSLEREAETTRHWAAQIGHAHPHLARQARRLADRWPVPLHAVEPGPDVPIHKDLHPGHVLVGDATWVIDLDEARRGDPAFDVAHFCTYLALAADTQADAPGPDEFRAAYEAESGWTDRGTYAPFCAYVWLKIAKQWTVGSGPGRSASPAQRLAGAEAALARGEACLSG